MKGLVRLAVDHAPAMNLVMVAVLVTGVLCGRALRRESFPEFDLDRILVTVPYPGATPEEVEEGICQKIEEAVRSLEGIKKVTSVAAEGAANVVIELDTDARSPDRVLDEVRSEVDRIPSFPLESEDPEIQLVTIRRGAIRVGVIGPDAEGSAAELRLREVAESIRDDLLLLPGVTQVEVMGSRDYQIDIEIPEDTLRSYGLSLQGAANIIRRENHQLPGGAIRGPSQEVLLRSDNRRMVGAEIGKLPLVTQPGGAVLTVEDLGHVRDEFTDTAAISRINQRAGIALSVQRSTKEDLLALVDNVKNYVATRKMPPGYRLITWGDQSVEVRGRLDLLIKNGLAGLLIVFLLLAIFLEIRLAFWVSMGIPIAIFATCSFLLFAGQTLNMLSMFAFVMALGIVVDDAIVIGENIYAHRQMGKTHVQAAIDGAAEVAPSVVAAVLTTVVAFMPLLFVSGMMGKFMAILPVAAIAMLTVSLVEAMTILPCHLAHADGLFFRLLNVVFYVFRWLLLLIGQINRFANSLLQKYVEHIYVPTLRLTLANRSVFLSACVCLLALAIGLERAGITPFVIFPKLDGNTIIASIAFPDGTSEAVTDRWTKLLEDSLWRVNQRLEEEGRGVARTSYRVVGERISSGGPGSEEQASSGSHLGSVEIELLDVSRRQLSSEQILDLWRAEVAKSAPAGVPGVESLTFQAFVIGPAGTPIEFKLLAKKNDAAELERAVEQCKARLAEYPGVREIDDDSKPGKWEYRLRVKEEAVAMGVRPADLAETVRASYYGQEVMRLQRGRHEVKLMVRYPRQDRRQLANFQEIRVRTDDGAERPLTELAEVRVERGYSEINRLNQLRSITISADVDETVANARAIVKSLQVGFIPDLLKQYPGMQVRWEGQQEQTQESVRSLFVGFGVAILVMFVLLAFEFKSYVQPLLILVILPFGIIGAIAGHAILGMPLMLFSLFGIVALTGIVVNDSIVLLDFINARVAEGMPIDTALLEAGRRRFRPVMLTTVTTVGGLSPILMETSLQAQILIPMATSIAFGEIFATVLVLYLVPVLYSLYAQAASLRLRG